MKITPCLSKSKWCILEVTWCVEWAFKISKSSSLFANNAGISSFQCWILTTFSPKIFVKNQFLLFVQTYDLRYHLSLFIFHLNFFFLNFQILCRHTHMDYSVIFHDCRCFSHFILNNNSMSERSRTSAFKFNIHSKNKFLLQKIMELLLDHFQVTHFNFYIT